MSEDPDVVERVARALFWAEDAAADWSYFSDEFKAPYRRAAVAAVAALSADTALRDALRVHHPIMRSETGPFSGCRCGQVKLGQDVIAHVVEHLSAAVRIPDVHLVPAGEDDHHHGWDCYCVPPWTDADGVRTYHHRDASYWANR